MNNIYQTQNRPNPYDPRTQSHQTPTNQPSNYMTNQNIAPQFSNQPTLQTTKAKSAFETYQYPQSRQQPLGEITNLQRPNVPVQHQSPIKPRNMPSMAPMTLMNGVSSEELTILLKDANKRLAKKLKTKGCLNQEDVYIGKMKWLLAMVKTQRKLNKHNLNPLGVNIEKIIEESSFAMNVSLFQDQNKLRRTQRNLAHFLAKLEPQKAILLSYKLFKMHLKQGNLQETQTQQEIAQKAYIFFLPYIELIEAKELNVKEKTQKKRNSLMTYQRIKKFVTKPEILHILQKFPDYKNTPEFKSKFESFLAEKLTLQQAMSVMTLKTQSMVMGDGSMIPDDSVVELPTAPNTQGSLEDLDLVESEMYGRALENARSMDLDEGNDNFGMHLSKLGNYSHGQAPSKLIHDSMKAEQAKLAGTRQSRPEFPQNVIRRRDLSSDAQSNDSSFSDNETDKELMNDPDLYLPNKDRFLSPPREKLKSLAQKRPLCFKGDATPKEFIASTLADVPPTGRVLNLLKKKHTFGEQLFKKHQEKAKHLVLEFVHMIVHGSKSAYKDAKYLASIVSSKPKSSYTVEEIREVKRISRDLTKFVPFYAALLIPAGELALFPYLYLFPRAVPSYFMSEKALKEEKYKYIDNQARGHEALREHLLSAMTKLGYEAEKGNHESMKEFFTQNHQALLEVLDIHKMDSEMLKNASDFLMFEYVEGTYILNTLYKSLVNLPRHGINLAMWVARNSYRAIWEHPFFNYNFKMNSFPFEGLKKTFIKYQFEKQLKSMKAQNHAMLSNFYGNLSDNIMVDIAQERGHASNKEEEAKKFIRDEWTQVAQTNLNNEQYLFWYSVMLYECRC